MAFDANTILLPVTLISLGIGITVGFMTIKNNINAARDANKKAAEERITQAETKIITHVDNKIGAIEAKMATRGEQLNELKKSVDDMEVQVDSLEKKAVAYDLKVPELERMKEEFLKLKSLVDTKLLSGYRSGKR